MHHMVAKSKLMLWVSRPSAQASLVQALYSKAIIDDNIVPLNNTAVLDLPTSF